ncbi:MAG: radical SAM protein [Clostridiales bacterium]|nr:radical SAM protein [Clostridiales bacterium]
MHSGGSQATDSQAAGSRTARYRELANDHPCFSQGAHGRKGRLHLPVSGHCNIRCRFCERAFNSNEQRPGVSSGLLAPGKALEIVAKALELCPDIKVVGIAGPGDALASPAALDAFAEIHRAHPELIKCLSTNGLALPGKARALAAVGVRSATVTVNAVDPKIAGDIVSYIVYENKAYRGAEAGEILVRRQLAGIREAVREGIAVKINTVLIPPVNGRHIEDIARAVAAEGAHMHNIIPLIPQSEFARMAPPSCEEIENARAVAGEYMPQFRHCAHCRADACGVPGVSDFSGLLYAEGGLSRDTFSHG